ncbi:MAG: dipeptidase PepE [Propionibacterium sp.]|nr:dipeptidase PepE [Propionibacterium sp.]
MSELLLLSNSTTAGNGYLEHAQEAIRELAESTSATARHVAFVPYALADRDAYTSRVAAALEPWGLSVHGVHRGDSPARIVEEADIVFVGGGNTFRLVDALHRTGLIEAIQRAVAGGTAYLGSSAGTNVATPTLCTTNDMPIVEPPSFRTLGLVPFQINPHYLDPRPGDTHQGETREERILQYLEESVTPIIAMREGTWMRVHDSRAVLGGLEVGARVFRRGVEPVEIGPGTDVTALLQSDSGPSHTSSTGTH